MRLGLRARISQTVGSALGRAAGAFCIKSLISAEADAGYYIHRQRLSQWLSHSLAMVHRQRLGGIKHARRSSDGVSRARHKASLAKALTLSRNGTQAALMGCHARHKAALATTIYAEAGSSSDGEVDEEATDPVTVRRARARRVGSSKEKRGQCV